MEKKLRARVQAYCRSKLVKGDFRYLPFTQRARATHYIARHIALSRREETALDTDVTVYEEDQLLTFIPKETPHFPEHSLQSSRRVKPEKPDRHALQRIGTWISWAFRAFN